MAAAVQRLTPGNTAVEKEIRPKMLKTLNGEGERWLTTMCQVAWKLGKTPNDWKTGVIIPIDKKSDRKECTNYCGYITSLAFQKWCTQSALKENDKK